ncbi:hypothetical protein H9X78_12175 [Clostridium saudiense]|nr:hypothetical protein [Clostridium saudiense]
MKLGLLLLSLSLVACGQKSNSAGEDNSSKSSTSQSVSSTQSSEEESVKTTSPSVENAVESKQGDGDVPKNTQQDTEQDTTKNELFSVVELNTVQGVCEYYLNSLDVTPKIEPSTITGSHSYYEVKTEGNIYIDAVIGVKNLNNESKMADDIITAKIKINSNEYMCFSVAESTDGYTLEKDASIKPLEKREIHYVAEVPKTEATGEIEIILTVNGKDYSNKFHLEGTQSSVKENTQQDEKQFLTEEEYYTIIKEAKQRQQDYIDSIDDPQVKQSVQTSYSAAIAESTALYIKYPEDTDAIDSALKRVLNGE